MSTDLDKPSPPPPAARDIRLVDDAPGLSGALRDFGRRVAQGDLGNLPVIVGIVMIWIIFQFADDRFLSSRNLTSLVLQMAATGTIAIGIVLVLLLGDIDLSAGSVSGLAAAVMAVLNQKHEWNAELAIVAGILCGTAIGLLHGLWITKLRVPAFVVTLAGLLAWQGGLLKVLGRTGSINVRDEGITRWAGTFYADSTGWIIGVVIVAAYAGFAVLDRSRRAAAGLHMRSLWTFVARLVLMGVAVFAAVAVFNDDRGVPLVALIFVGLVVVFDLVTRRTRFGRHVFAVGGNQEAARRAGIKVDRVRIAVFILCSTLAAIGGILAASRGLAVSQSSGGSTTLLNAIAAAVIGGTSLFGGRGSAWSALLGILVIQSISNGMDLLAVESSIEYMVTGGVLLVAATVDAVSRRGRVSAGRA
jgi:D-xylose transport system permease protein